MYSTGILIRSKAMMLKSSLCNYSDPYILVSGKITINGERADDAAKWTNKKNKKVLFINCAPFIKCIKCISEKTKQTISKQMAK